jgi:hypothetical protein
MHTWFETDSDMARRIWLTQLFVKYIFFSKIMGNAKIKASESVADLVYWK